MGSFTLNGYPVNTPTGEYSDDDYVSSEDELQKTTPPEDVDSKDGAFTWPFTRLSELAKEAKGRVNRGMVNFIRKHLKGTRLIFVVGETGTGKTTLLGEITGQKDLKVGNTSKSGTLGYQVVPAILHGEQYVFVDTPGFGAADLNDKAVYEDIMSCVCTLGQWVTIAGVMFVRDVVKPRLTDSEMKTIRWLQCFCGPQFFKNITIVQMKWDTIHPDSLDQARDIAKEVETSAFEDILSPKHVKGGCLYNHGVHTGDGSEWDVISQKWRPKERCQMAADFVQKHYGSCDGVARLQVLEELGKGWGIYETEAAKSLFSTFSSPQLCILRSKAFLVDLNEEVVPKPRVEEVKSAAGGEPPQEKRPPKSTSLKWWEIAKEVAWTFWGFETTGKTKVTEWRDSVTADAWQRLKNWWSGEKPPQ